MLEHKKEEFDKKEFGFGKKLITMKEREDFASHLPAEKFNRKNVEIEEKVTQKYC
jgi:hypothetical protein